MACPRRHEFISNFPDLPCSVFARAPMILPGSPFGRPCALAKTPARTRKHCNFARSFLRTPKSDNVYSSIAPPGISSSLTASSPILFTKHPHGPPFRVAPRSFTRLPHSFLARHSHRGNSFERLITSAPPLRSVPATRSRSFTEIIGPCHFHYSDSIAFHN